MSKQTEDTLMAVHLEVTRLGLVKEFNAQLRRMASLKEYKWIDMATKYEYALAQIKENYAKLK